MAILEQALREIDSQAAAPALPVEVGAVQVETIAGARRGRTWQTDCYPSPGAIINVYAPSGSLMTPNPSALGYTGWPFINYQSNLPPNP